MFFFEFSFDSTYLMHKMTCRVCPKLFCYCRPFPKILSFSTKRQMELGQYKLTHLTPLQSDRTQNVPVKCIMYLKLIYNYNLMIYLQDVYSILFVSILYIAQVYFVVDQHNPFWYQCVPNTNPSICDFIYYIKIGLKINQMLEKKNKNKLYLLYLHT